MRTGSCLQCGKCCSFLGFPADAGEWAVYEFFKGRGLKIVDGMVHVPHVCPHLKPAEDGKFACDLHGNDKPEVCRDSPYDDRCKPKGCGFTFVEEQ